MGPSQYQTSSVIGGGPIMEDKGNLTVQNHSGRQPLCQQPKGEEGVWKMLTITDKGGGGSIKYWQCWQGGGGGQANADNHWLNYNLSFISELTFTVPQGGYGEYIYWVSPLLERKKIVRGLIMSFLPYMRSEMVRFPLPNKNDSDETKNLNSVFYQLCQFSLAIPVLSLAIPVLSLAISCLSLLVPASQSQDVPGKSYPPPCLVWSVPCLPLPKSLCMFIIHLVSHLSEIYYKLQ